MQKYRFIQILVAKDHVLGMITKGLQKSCADELKKDEEFEIPSWYNEAKYKRLVLEI